MTAEDALNEHFATSGIYEEGCTRDDWYPGHVVSLVVADRKLPVFPVLRRGGPIILHDLHHLLTGYPPTWKGEAELAGWELGSGGCGWHLVYWLDRLFFLLLGVVVTPRALLRAFVRGLRSHNLFGMSPKAVLRMEVDALRAYAGVSAQAS